MKIKKKFDLNFENFQGFALKKFDEISFREFRKTSSNQAPDSWLF